MAEDSKVNTPTNLISYVSTASDTSSASKAYVSNSSNDFANVFDSANKAYSEEKEPTKTVENNNADNTKNSDYRVVKNEKSENNNEVKNKNVEEKKSGKNQKEENSVSENEHASEETKPAHVEDVTATTEKLKTEKIDENVSTPIVVDVKPVDAIPVAIETPATQPNNVPIPAESTGNMNDIKDIKVSTAADGAIELLALNTQNPIVASNDTAVNPAIASSVETPPASSIASQEDFSVNLANTLDGLKANAKAQTPEEVKPEAQVPTQVQIKDQSQQVLSELNKNVQAASAPLQQAIPAETVANSDIQIPVIQVSAEAVVSDVNINKNDTVAKEDVKDVLDKTSLNQGVLDKLNAKVVSAVSANSNQGTNQNANPDANANPNLDASTNPAPNSVKNKQNTADQMAKLSLEDNSSVQVDAKNNTLAATVNATEQNSFAKTLDSVQIPVTTQPQVQVPKELNNTEIMSQIHNKLNSFKDEGTSKLSIVLRPENLGKVDLELINTKEGLTAQMTTSNPQVKEILDKSLATLKDNLANQGVNVTNVTVKVDETQKQSSNDTFAFNQGQSDAENQESAKNAHRQNQKTSQGVSQGLDNSDSSLEEDIDSGVMSAQNEMEKYGGSERLVSVGSSTGRVNYKV